MVSLELDVVVCIYECMGRYQIDAAFRSPFAAPSLPSPAYNPPASPYSTLAQRPFPKNLCGYSLPHRHESSGYAPAASSYLVPIPPPTSQSQLTFPCSCLFIYSSMVGVGVGMGAIRAQPTSSDTSHTAPSPVPSQPPPAPSRPPGQRVA